MVEVYEFNPFIDRQSRDIRNGLSSSLVECLECGIIDPAQKTADSFLNRNVKGKSYITYIEERLRRYRQAVATITEGSDDPFWRSLVLWDLELFFEMHEVLEHAWYHAEGDTKHIMQALIRAAGVYIKLDYGYVPQARKMAAKSLEVLEKHREFLSQYFRPDLLIEALKSLTPTPPKLLGRV